jgi:protein-S-isoprenylcysteine O-methyltransferase Ste14
MAENLFHGVYVAVMIAFVLLRGYYQKKALAARGKADYKEGALYLVVRFALGIPLMLLLVATIFNPVIMAWAAFPLGDSFRWLGVLLGPLSIALLIWLHQTLGANFSRMLHIRQDHNLVTAGPYRWVRHPMYTALLLLGTAILLLTANWLVGGFFLLSAALTVAVRMRHEEAAMLEKFGPAYRDYMARTKRFIPGIA